MSSLSPAEELFFAALARPTAPERAAFLDEACQAAPVGLREHVERLLAAHTAAGDFLDCPAPGWSATVERPAAPPTVQGGPKPGDRVGPYKLLEQIGDGGMGVVFMAEQQEPVRRRVALKIIKPGMDTHQVIARFEAERQALALMNHANIARVFDAGETDQGRPYFVMELVPGVPITEYCDHNHLPIHARLELFIQVCQAVQHAHQKGIIHRDLKPSNVLVTLNDGRPVPKVIDFGVAKAVSQRLTEKTVFTNFAQMIGTPLYMSPEQAEMTNLDIDTRADVYSLGVLLYELLTGTTPFSREDLERVAYDEMRKMIREQEPPRPSLRISTLGKVQTVVASHRHVDPHRLSYLIRGDLDWIVMRALEKDRTRRYDTATSLARDIERYLVDEPIEARPPSMLYRSRKYARRHRTALAALSMVALALVTGTAISTWQAIRATRAERVAEVARAAEAEQREKEHAAAERAEQQKAEADRQRSVALREAARAEQLLYGSQIRLADNFWESGQTQNAWDTLEKITPALRGWEHDYLYTQMTRDQQIFGEFTTDVGFAADDRQVVINTGDELQIVDPKIRRATLTIRKVAGGFSSMAVSADGTKIASGSTFGVVSLWDSKSGARLLTIKAHRNSVSCVAISPDGRRVISSEAEHSQKPSDHTIRIWDATSGDAMGVLTGHTKEVRAFAWSSDSSKLVSGSLDGTARVWDVAAGNELRVLDCRENSVFGVAFHPADKCVATASGDKLVRLWDVDSGEILEQLQPSTAGYSFGCRCVAFRPDGAELAASAGSEITIFDLSTGSRRDVLKGHVGAVNCVTYSRDGRRLVACEWDGGPIRVWDLQQHRRRSVVGQRAERWAGQAFYSPDAKSLLTNLDYQATVWDLETQRKRLTFPGEAASIAVSPDWQRVAIGDYEGSSTVFDLATERKIFSTPNALYNGLPHLAFSPDGSQLASGACEDKIRLWDSQSGMELATILRAESFSKFSFAPNGQTLVFSGRPEGIYIWSLGDKRQVSYTPVSDSPIQCSAFSADGRMILVSYVEDLAIFDASSGAKIVNLDGHTDFVQSACFSADGRRVVSGGDDRTIRIWDAENGQQLLTLRAGGEVKWVAFSPDGKRIVSTATDVGVEVWDATRSMPADLSVESLERN